MINQEILKQNLRYREDGCLIWIVKRKNINIGDVAGRTKENGYSEISINGKLYGTHRLIWLYFYGEMPENEIDHIDKNPRNNRIDNLRKATREQNSYNRTKQKNNTSGFKGVKKEKGNTWSASIWVNKKPRFLGCFYSPEEAYEAYKKAASELHKEFAYYE